MNEQHPYEQLVTSAEISQDASDDPISSYVINCSSKAAHIICLQTSHTEQNGVIEDIQIEVANHLKGEFDELVFNKENNMYVNKAGFYQVSKEAVEKGWSFFETILRHPSNAQALLKLLLIIEGGGKPAILNFDPKRGILVGETHTSNNDRATKDPNKSGTHGRGNLVYDRHAQRLEGIYCDGNVEEEVKKLGLDLMTIETAKAHLLPGDFLCADFLRAPNKREAGDSVVVLLRNGSETTFPRVGHRTHMSTLGFRGQIWITIPPQAA